MLPEVKQFHDEHAAAERNFQANRRKVNSYYDDKSSDMTYQKAKDILEKETREAWDKLKKSDNKLVAWIANNNNLWERYRRPAIIILDALPCSLEDLDGIAKYHDWCSDWDDFRNDAINDGIITVQYVLNLKYNAWDWDEFYNLNTRDGSYLTRDFFIDMHKKGIREMQFELNRDIIRVKVEVQSEILS